MRSRHYESTWIVVTFDGLFMRTDGGVSQEYPDAAEFPREGLARRAAQTAKNLGPYNVVTTEDYARGVA